jgi:hypothetical protein
MRQRIRSHLTYANVMATLAVFLVLGGGTALASYVVSSNSQIAPGTVSGHKPPSGKHANIIGGSINGKDVADNSLGGVDVNEASLTGDARKLIYNASASRLPAPTTKIATVGPYTIKGGCETADTVDVLLFANGPAGSFQVMDDATVNDNTDHGTFSNGREFPANKDILLTSAGAMGGEFTRIAGTAILRSGSTLVQVDFDAVVDDRSSPGGCLIYGTATKAT